MKKYCILLTILNLICIAVLVVQHYTSSEKRMAYSKATDSKTADSKKEIESGSSKDDLYLGNGDEKLRVALTFDDGPNPEWTPVLLDGLKERGVKASFFVIGEKAQESKDLVKRMYDEGHIIGNHTFSHVQLTAIGNDSACEEIVKANQVLYDITGEYPQFIRPPFGSYA